MASEPNETIDSSKMIISDEELDELTNKVEFMLTQLRSVNAFVNKLHGIVDQGLFDNTQHGMTLLDIKVHLLISYCAKLCLYISKRASGDSVANHELLNQLALTSWIMDKLRTVQKQCQYSIDKLLDHAKRAVDPTKSAVDPNDDLSHKPNLDALRPPVSGSSVFGNKNEVNNTSGSPDDPLDIDHKPKRNEDGIYRPLKLNPKLMDTPNNQLTKKQERMVAQMTKRVKNSELYMSVKESLSKRPAEEKFFLQNTERFSINQDGEVRSKTRHQDINKFEENNMKRMTSSKREFKKMYKSKRKQEKHAGDDMNEFVDKLNNQFVNARRLGDFKAGAKFEETVGKAMKKKGFKGGKYIPGGWRQRERVLFLRTKQGKQVARRRAWRKLHPLKQNPAKNAKRKRMKYLRTRKTKKLLKKLNSR